MSETNKHLEVRDNIVVTMDYTLMVDGEVVDSSEDSEPLQFIQGSGEVLPALEEQLYGMSVGSRKEIVLSAADSYGEKDPEAFMDIPRSEFPNEIPLKVGTELELQDPEGEKSYARVQSVDKQNVRLDLNHPLAGKQLNFSIHIVALRLATPVEQEHGHVHTASTHN